MPAQLCPHTDLVAGIRHVWSRSVQIPGPTQEALEWARKALRTCAPEQRQYILNYINNLLDWVNSR